MAFNDYRPAWAVKGLTAPERLVLLALAEHRHGEHDKDYQPVLPRIHLAGGGDGAVTTVNQQGNEGSQGEGPLGVHGGRQGTAGPTGTRFLGTRPEGRVHLMNPVFPY